MPPSETQTSLELLYNISRELASALDLRTVLQSILLQSLKYVGGEHGSIVVLDEAGKIVDAAIVYRGKVQNQITPLLREVTECGLAGWVIRNRQPVWIPDTRGDNRWMPRPEDVDEPEAKAVLCVPLMARDRLTGVLTLVHSQQGAYDKEHLDLVQAIADQAGIAVLNASLYAESQRQARTMTALAASSAAINVSLRLDEVLQRILDETIQALQVETVALALVERNWDLVFRAATGENKAGIIGKRVPAGLGVIGWVVHEGEGAVIPAVEEDDRFSPRVEQFEGLQVRAVAVAPIYSQGRVIGALQAINPWAGAFEPGALLVLTGIGNLAGTAIQHAQLFEHLQAAHKRYRELFDDSEDPIFITDLEGKIHEANRQAALISEYTPDQLHGTAIIQLYTALHADEDIRTENLRDGKTAGCEATLKSRTGREIPIQIRARRMVFEETESLQWLMRDITERKDLDRLREDMTSMILHDVRSPLANVVSSLDVLSEIYADEKVEGAQSVIAIARRATDRVQRLINSLLDVNRLEAGQAIVSQRSVALAALAEEALEAVRPVAESRRQILTSRLPKKLPLLWVDEDMIRRVLINLLENASKFTPPQGTIGLGARSEAGWVHVWVKDDGPGIPPSEQENIFAKFTRLKREKSSSGLGIGLAFCRLAVEGHGGTIHVESQSGHGSKFILTLPIAEAK